ncbi:hypothetical protein BJX63DRAFT_426662 [Aspergillus granulosus]|uniref:Uncharacterized protein n=1 Tax=Aspergillus granulosus TaxID=176169 RepID=A0ABR4GRC4_9EURO
MYFTVKLFKTPCNIWLSIKNFLTPADIFKDTSWLDFAFNWCSLVLIGYNLSAYCPRKLSTCLYLAFIAYNYSGDLKYKCKSYKTVKLPLEKIFTNIKKGVYLEYYYYKYPDPDYSTYPRVSPGGWNSPACKGRDIKNGCRLILLDQGIKRTYIILPRHLKSKIWAKIA